MKRREFLVGTLGTVGAAVPIIGAAAASPPCMPHNLAVGGGLSVGTACPIPPAGPMPAWLQSAAVYQWMPLPSLGASSVLPNPTPPGASGVSSVVGDWSGGALRTSGSYYLLHGGGHTDYAGNELYALQLSLDNPQWTRVWGPTPNAQIVPDQNYYNDSPPSPAQGTHTYNGLTYDDQDDIFMRFGRGQFNVGGASPGVDGLQWGASSWEQNQNNTIWPAQPSGWGYGNGQCKDPNGNVYMVCSWSRIVWARQANTWSTPIANSKYAVIASGCCYDSTRNVIWSFGGSYGGGSVGAGQAYRWNVAAKSDALVTLVGPSAGGIDGQHANFCGAAYDPVVDLVFVLTGDGNIYSFNPSTYIVIQLATAGPALPNTTSNSATGPWGKFQYAAELGGVVIQPTWSSPTYFMRTH